MDDERRAIQGWSVRVHPALRQSNAAMLEKALALLNRQLVAVRKRVPKKSLARLREVTLFLSPEYPGFPPRAEYHPDADWLREHGRNPEMARHVELTNLRIFEAETRRMPLFVLHELAHAFHDRVLGSDEPRLLAAYARATADGKYERVERRDSEGRVRMDRAYALTSVQEYFAEGSEAFFGANDFFPFDRRQLKTHDPTLLTLLEKIWA